MVPDSDLNHDEELFQDTETEAEKSVPSPFWQGINRAVKNILLSLFCVFIAVLWLFDWNLSHFANTTSDLVAGLFDDELAEARTAPEIPALSSIPELPELPQGIESKIEAEIEANQGKLELEMSMTDYVARIREAGYRDQFSMAALTAFYHAGVTTQYLDQLNEAGFLDQLSFPAVITFHSTGVTTDYLEEMQQAGYLEQFGFPALASFYSAEIPVSYLNSLNEQGVLQDLSFSDILVMFQSE